VRRTMPLPQERLVGGTHVHHHIIAILDAPLTRSTSRTGDPGRDGLWLQDADIGR
jgi:hypothetical protein